MDQSITKSTGWTIGLDLGDRFTEGCVLDEQGEVLERFRVRTRTRDLARELGAYGPSRVVLEVGINSPWISRLSTACGHETIVANPRRVRLIAENDSKSDTVDAELLARLARIDPGLLKPIVHRGEQAQRDRILIQARDGFVRARTQLVNQVRGFAKSLGTRLPSCSTVTFTKKVRSSEGDDFFPGLSTMLDMIDAVSERIRGMDREIEKLSKERIPRHSFCVRFPGSDHLPLSVLSWRSRIPDDSPRVARLERTSGLDPDKQTRANTNLSFASPRQEIGC